MKQEFDNRRKSAELNEDELDGVCGGRQSQTPPAQPMPSRPSIPADPGLTGLNPAEVDLANIIAGAKKQQEAKQNPTRR